MVALLKLSKSNTDRNYLRHAELENQNWKNAFKIDANGSTNN